MRSKMAVEPVASAALPDSSAGMTEREPGLMRLTFQALGLELDITLGPTTVDDEPEPDPRGDVLSTPIGFTRPEIPWEDSGSMHQFDPEPDGEDARRNLGKRRL